MLWGSEWIEELHEALAYGTLALIALHVLGVIAASWQHGENLVKSMLTGRKRA
ncbi:MAG: cytochrome b/b6 domain-containing protein [Aestuariivirga sp.]